MKTHKYTHNKSVLVLIDIRLIPIYPSGKILRIRIYRWTFKWKIRWVVTKIICITTNKL